MTGPWITTLTVELRDARGLCICFGSSAGELSDALVVWRENQEWSDCKELRLEKLIEWEGYRGQSTWVPPESLWTVFLL